MSNYQTIRKNSTKRIRALLEQAVLITEYSDHETSTERNAVSREAALAFIQSDFCKRVYTKHDTDTGEAYELCFSAGHWHFFTSYLSIEAAKRQLNKRDFERHFGEGAGAKVAGLHPEERAAQMAQKIHNRFKAEKPAPLELVSEPEPMAAAVNLQARLEFAQARHRGLCAEMMNVFATFATLQHGAAKLAYISAQAAAAEAEVKELTVRLLELTSPKCKPTRGAGQIMVSATPQHAGMFN